MPTTIRVEDVVKRDLDALQGEFLAERGERLSHSEVLARLLRFARRHEGELLAEADRPRFTRADLEKFLRRLPKFDTKSDARNYKRELYGRRP